jgi:hypothetical protein
VIYRAAPFFYNDCEVIGPFSKEALGEQCRVSLGLASPSSGTWVANLAVFVPFGVSHPFLVREMWWYNGSTAASTIDVGLYDTAGNRLASLGNTAQGTVSSVVTSTTFTDYTLAPGDYYMAFVCAGTTATVGVWAPAANNIAAYGVGQTALGSATLTNPSTIVPITNALLPYFGLNGNTVTV